MPVERDDHVARAQKVWQQVGEHVTHVLNHGAEAGALDRWVWKSEEGIVEIETRTRGILVLRPYEAWAFCEGLDVGFNT